MDEMHYVCSKSYDITVITMLYKLLLLYHIRKYTE